MKLIVEPDLNRATWVDGTFTFRRVWGDGERTCIVGWIIQDGNMWRWALRKDWMALDGSGFHDFTKIRSDPLPEPEAVAAMYAVWRMKYGGKA